MNQPYEPIPDVPSSPDHRRLAIQRGGIKDLRYPVLVRTADGGVQSSVARVDADVALPAERKGTHMSRFVEMLESADAALDYSTLAEMARGMCRRLDAQAGRLAFRFVLFVRKVAPVSGVASLMDYEVQWIAQVDGDSTKVTAVVQVPVKALCPCSKEISKYGAHNQRSHITITAELRESMSLESLIRMAEEEASCEIWGLLKRPDEKYVTERAYDNPKFVEDLVRDVAARVGAEPRIASFVVEAENFESIHNHSAYARIEG
ncbi:MAG: GTP cyclohydrolase I FolE2 [Betaproteobacteria bacterium]|nr:GTP cyclohydrolase I FolE2 [Betaproteobacteria bacterium]